MIINIYEYDIVAFYNNVLVYCDRNDARTLKAAKNVASKKLLKLQLADKSHLISKLPKGAKKGKFTYGVTYRHKTIEYLWSFRYDSNLKVTEIKGNV